ncbi:MBL fold metallo-hydrolase [Candidatus Magnetomoraceae bacterium gMMP-15]
MKIKFWGVRGSIPAPGPDSIRYGGNTPCIEVVTNQGDEIILDSGSGIRQLGLNLMAKLPVKCSIFITHTHWDHIQGLPFFVPLFVEGNKIKLLGAFDPISGRPLKEVLDRQLEYCYFPIRSAELKAKTEYITLVEGQAVQVGSAVVSSIFTNHTVLNLGYKIKADGKSIVYTGDHENPYNIYGSDDQDYDEFEKLLYKKSKALQEFIDGADILIADSQYTDEEYSTKKGWGHSTYRMSFELAKASKVKSIYMFHHDPTRTDDDLDKIYLQIKKFKKHDNEPEIFIAREGQEINL